MSLAPEGMRGAMSEIAEEADKGLIPAVETMNARIGEQAGYVEQVHKSGRLWRDVLREQKDALLAQIGPYGDVLGAVGSMVAGLGTFFIAFPAGAGLVSKAAVGMWTAITGPVGLVIAALVAVGVAVYVFRDDIKEAFGIAADAAEDWSIRTGDALVDASPKFLEATQVAIDATDEWIELLAKANKAEAAIPGKLSPFYTAMKNKAAALREGANAALLSAQALSEEAEAVRKSIIVDRESARVKREATEAAIEQAAAISSVAVELESVARLWEGMDDIKIELPEIDWSKASESAEVFGKQLPLAVVRGIDDGAVKAGEKAGSDFLSALGAIDIAGTFSKAFQGGGGFMGAVKSLASQVASVFTDALGGLLKKGLGGILQGVLGGGGGGIGGAVSQAFSGAGALGASSFIGGLFGAGGGAAAAAGASVTIGGSAVGGVAAGGGLFGGAAAGFMSVAAAIPGWGWAAAGVVAGGLLVAKLFSKPSKLEKEGRRAAEEARNAIASTLTDGQVAEAAGNMGNAVHIAVRDAMLGAGRSIAEAEAQATKFVEELWRAEKEGPEAVKAVHDSITGLIAALGDTNSELNKTFADRSFTVTQHLRTTGGHSNPNEYAEPRQHGGTVTGGRPYLVGEAGPELFIPRQSGSIAPGGGSSKQRAEEIGQAVARAVQHGINVVIPPDQITDAVIRRTPSRVALRGSGG